MLLASEGSENGGEPILPVHTKIMNEVLRRDMNDERSFPLPPTDKNDEAFGQPQARRCIIGLSSKKFASDGISCSFSR